MTTPPGCPCAPRRLKVASVTPAGTVQDCTLPVNLKVSVVAEAGAASASIPTTSAERHERDTAV